MKIRTIIGLAVITGLTLTNVQQWRLRQRDEMKISIRNNDIVQLTKAMNEICTENAVLNANLSAANSQINALWDYKKTFLSLEGNGIKITENISDILSQLNNAPYGNPFGQNAFNITSPFGERLSPFTGKLSNHGGIDLVPLSGNGDIYHLANGIVESFEYDDLYGWNMWVDHGEFKTRYAHLEYAYWQDRENKLIAGVKITKGQLLGRMGQSGGAFGRHLHYEIWMKIDGKLIQLNPEEILNYIGE